MIDDERNANDTLIISVNESNHNLADMSLKIKMTEITEATDGSEENSYFRDNTSENINLPDKDEEDLSQKNDLVEDLDNSLKEENSINDVKI